MILLIGATGFIGKYFFNVTSDNIRCVVRDKYRGEISHHEIEYISDLGGNNIWNENIFNNIDVIIYLAGIAHSKIGSSKSIDRDAALNLAKYANLYGVKRFVYMSSISVYGSKNKKINKSDKKTPETLSALHKSQAESELIKMSKTSNLDVVIVRSPLVYGFNAPGNFGLLTKLITKFPVLPFGCVNNNRDFISVQNLADLLLTCAKHPDAAGHTFLASDGESISIKEFTNAIAKGLNKSIYQFPIPVALMHFGAKLIGKQTMAEQLLGDLEVDSSNAFDVMGWKPPYTMEQAMSLLSKEVK